MQPSTLQGVQRSLGKVHSIDNTLETRRLHATLYEMERCRRCLRRPSWTIRWGIFAVVLLFFGSSLVESYANEDEEDEDEEEEEEEEEYDHSPGECHIHEQQCGIYMALSTIPGAGLGSFTGVDRQEGDVISDGDVMLPIYDLEYHLQALGPEMTRHKDWEYIDPTRDYVWWGPDVLMRRESAHPDAHLHGTFVRCIRTGFDPQRSFSRAFHSGVRNGLGIGCGHQLPSGALQCQQEIPVL
jgi:hypothetical protein